MNILEQVETLLSERRFSMLRSLVLDMEPADIGALMEDMDKEEQRLLFFRLLPKELAAEAFVEVDGDVQEDLIRAFSGSEISAVMDELYVDDAVDMIEEMPANVVRRILKYTDPAMRQTINDILKYPSDSAGSLMTTEYVDLKEHMTVAQAFDHIRKIGVDKETIYTCYVMGKDRKLLGIVTVKDLLLSDKEAVLTDIMDTNVLFVDTLEDKEVVVQQFAKYDLLALPVVDKEHRLVGIITFDDAMDVMQEENTEDIEKMAAILPTDKPYMRTGVLETWRKRIPWLLFLMVSATFTGMIISGFEQKLAASVVLTAFIPMLMDTGGNSGSQASVTIIRGLSLGEIEWSDTFAVIWKEIRVAVLCGAVLAAVNFGKMMLVDNLLLHNAAVTPMVAAVVCVTLVVTVFFAKIVGCTLPILAKQVGLDPAVMASPFITTIVDALSLLVYFNIAGILLHL
ncbi:MAG: magnesium transporter [Clostridia bacterium]|nr:magnesium transporter [Clostridia bacterium]